MASLGMLLDLTLSDPEGQIRIGQILAPSLQKIRSNYDEYSWLTFLFGVGLP